MENYLYERNRVVPSSEGIIKVYRSFALSLVVSILGFAIGSFVPPTLMLPLVIVELGMLITAMLIRKKNMINHAFLFAFTFISGITAFPVVSHYIGSMGIQLVGLAFGLTTAIFVSISIYGLATKKDFSFLGGMLFAGLIAILAVAIFGIFSPLSANASTVAAIIGALIFSGFILFDANRMKVHGVKNEQVPQLALSLFLDFINLFFSLLRIIDRFR